MKKVKLNVHFYPSTITNESRILKETLSIIKKDLAEQIHITGIWGEGLPLEQPVDERRTIYRIKTGFESRRTILHLGFLFLLFIVKSFWRYYRLKPEVVNCHVLSILFLGVLLKKTCGSKLIYDAHELETERAGMQGFRKKFAKWLEHRLIGYADTIIVVNDSIKEWYEKEYGLNNIYAIKNVPEQKKLKELPRKNLLKTEFAIGDDELVFLYQGIIGKGRGIEKILNAFTGLEDQSKHLVLMGYGQMVPLVMEYEKKYSSIHYKAAVPPEEVLKYTHGADVGIALIENLGLSYYFCLPNKLFEYILAGKPVIASNFPEMSNVISKYQCGWLIEPNAEAIRNTIEQISVDTVYSHRPRAEQIASDFGWEKEESKIYEAFAALN